ncbi:Copia protein [Araneus ventricosus]|uniref:Copia protein n=1 Tax=Araneus ventricosus TaxID=182803 RepID=A0A4Y2K0I2_ARAVE|nr:Copia protein [Araneus ventricosus]
MQIALKCPKLKGCGVLDPVVSLICSKYILISTHCVDRYPTQLINQNVKPRKGDRNTCETLRGLNQLQEHPIDAASCALKKILYLKGAAKMKINYKKCNLYDSDLSLYVDADWGSNLYDRILVSGYLITFCNIPILWCVNEQKCISLSSTEAEIIALSEGVQDLLRIKGIASEIVSVKNLIVYEDNQSCIKCIANENNFGRMKHIDVKLKFIRDIVSRNKIKIEYIFTGNQIADMLTKALLKLNFMNI